MNTLLRRTAIAAISAALVLGTTVGAAGAAETDEAADKAIKCESKASGGDGPFYNGKSASYMYDRKFGQGPDVPGLDTHTPQGIASWKNWDGKGHDLMLVSSYRGGADAHIIGIDPSSGKHVGTVAIAESHAGGIAVSNGWAFVQGRPSGKWGTVRKYKLSALRDAMAKGGVPYLKQEGKARNVYAASFLSSYGDSLYAGKFNDKGRGKMYRYKVNNDGSLVTEKEPYEVPTKTQGLMVTKDHFVFSTSLGNDKRSNIYVTANGARHIDTPATKCFRAPSMAEGIAEHDGTAFLVYESGSYKYMAKHPRNVIQTLHKSKITELTKF
jgi:hypothetical protein